MDLFILYAHLVLLLEFAEVDFYEVFVLHVFYLRCELEVFFELLVVFDEVFFIV